MNEIITQNLHNALTFLILQIKEELRQQGHSDTGRLERSLELEIIPRFSGFEGRIYIESYGMILNFGVKPSRVPYSPGSGKKSSKYIDALKAWVKRKNRGISDKKALGFAFAIAKKAKKEGHPTRGSYAYSKNGRRKAWAAWAIDKNIPKFEKILDLETQISLIIQDQINKLQKAA